MADTDTTDIDLSSAWVAAAGEGYFDATPEDNAAWARTLAGGAAPTNGHPISKGETVSMKIGAGMIIWLRGRGTVTVTRDTVPA